MASAADRWILDFLSLYAALAIIERPPLYVVRLACSAAQLLGQIPLTLGGLGVVEAGLTETLALAGIAAALAGLAAPPDRLAAAWLSAPGGVAAWIWRSRRSGVRSA